MVKKPHERAGRSYNIKGGIKAGRDVVMGDQNINLRQMASIDTPKQFLEELQKLKTEIARLRNDSSLTSSERRRVDVVEADVQDAIDEATKPVPVGERINRTLEGAKELMEKLGGNIAAAIGLSTSIAELAGIALKLFGH